MNLTIKRLAIALAASLAVNLFFLGFVTARALRGGPEPRRFERHGHFVSPRGLAGELQGEARKAMRDAFERRRPALRAQRKTLHASREAVSEAFAAEPFDRAALERALGELRAQTTESQRLVHEALVEVAPGLPPEQRARLARRALAPERRIIKRRR